MYTIQCDSWRE